MPELFGTNGVRGIANDYLTPELATKLARSLATYLGEGTIGIARDTRVSGEMLKSAAVAGVTSTGLDVLDLGILPSPGLQHYVRESRCDSGIIVTASHNPGPYNGIKFVDGDGVEYDEERLEEMEEIFFEEAFSSANWDSVGEVQEVDHTPDYVRHIQALVDTQTIADADLTVVVDPGNGAGYRATPRLMREIGCRVITLNANPDGTFPARDPEPLPENLHGLADAVVSLEADLGIAHDGDADRATFVDENGDTLPGERSLALLLAKELRDKGPGKIVTPVSSGFTVTETLEREGAEIIWTPVGSTKVARKMLATPGTIGGGEENGGVIYTDWVYCRDGAVTAARMAELIAERGSLSGLVEELPNFYTVKTKVECPEELKEQVMKDIATEVKKISDDVTTIDGVKAFLGDAWVLIRPSGTEPIIRVFTEAPTQDEADELAERGLDIAERAVKATA